MSLFYATVDIATTQLGRRFRGMEEIANRFQFLSPKELLLVKDDDLYSSANLLAVQYSDDLSSDFPLQLPSFRNVLRPAIEESSSIKDIAQLLYVKHHCLLSSFPEVATALKIFLTVPVTWLLPRGHFLS